MLAFLKQPLTHLKGFVWAISDRVEAGEEKVRFFISKLNLDEAQVQQKRKDAQKIEDYHRGLKPE